MPPLSPLDVPFFAFSLTSGLFLIPSSTPPPATAFRQVDLNAQNIVNTASKSRKEWGLGLKFTLPGYALLTSVQLIGMCLYVFARNSVITHVRDVEVSTVKTGAGGKVGNKGAVAVRMKLYSSRLCFVCAHLAAGKSHVLERNQDALDIMRRLDFGKGRSLDSHDYIFWSGDLNYRIELPYDRCKSLCASQSYPKLLPYDQLSMQRAEGNVFDDFHEGPITFAPTYKYDPFSDEYDTSEKQRVPSWTDRVLYRGERIKLLHYNCCAHLKTSDHRPVLALLNVPIDCVDHMAEAAVREEIMRSLRRAMTTVAVVCREQMLSVDEIQSALGDCGSISMIDQLDDGATTLVTFDTPAGATHAAELHNRPLPGGVGPLEIVVVGADAESGRDFDLTSLNSGELSTASSVSSAAVSTPMMHTGSSTPSDDRAGAAVEKARRAGAGGTKPPRASGSTEAPGGLFKMPQGRPHPDSPPPSYFEAMGGTMERNTQPPPRPKPPSRPHSMGDSNGTLASWSKHLEDETRTQSALGADTATPPALSTSVSRSNISAPARPPLPAASTRKSPEKPPPPVVSTAAAASSEPTPPPRSRRSSAQPSPPKATSTGGYSRRTSALEENVAASARSAPARPTPVRTAPQRPPPPQRPPRPSADVPKEEAAAASFRAEQMEELALDEAPHAGKVTVAVAVASGPSDAQREEVVEMIPGEETNGDGLAASVDVADRGAL